MEIYNERVYDLLDERNGDRPIELWERVSVREGRDGELQLRNLRLYDVTTERDVLNLLFLGNVNRMTAETPMNHASSRSHCIFTLTLERQAPGSDVVTTSKLNLVDLAGSERIFKTGVGSSAAPPTVAAAAAMNAAEVTRREGRYINLSLHHLEQVIIALQAQALRRASSAAAAVSSAADGGGGGVRRSASASHIAASGIAGSGSAVRGRSAVRGTPSSGSLTPTAAAAAAAGRRERSASASRGGGGGGGGGEAGSRRTSITSVGSGPSIAGRSAVTAAAALAASGSGALHVPYRNAMLTSVLRDSLGGNCRTVLIATVNPELEYVDESVSTCRFAVRCGQLSNDVSVNESRDLSVTVALLRRQLAASRSEAEAERTARLARDGALAAAVAALREAGLPIPPACTLQSLPAPSTPHRGSSPSPAAAVGAALALPPPAAAPSTSASAGGGPVVSTSMALASLRAGGTRPAVASGAVSVAPVPSSRRRELEGRIADSIRRGLPLPQPAPAPKAGGSESATTATAMAVVVPLKPDGRPVETSDGGSVPDGVRGLTALAGALRLTDLSDAYATVELLMDAVRRAVTVAADAGSEAEHERARAGSAAAAIEALQAQVGRYEREVRDWEARHGALLGDFNALTATSADLSRQVAAAAALAAATPAPAPIPAPAPAVAGPPPAAATVLDDSLGAADDGSRNGSPERSMRISPVTVPSGAPAASAAAAETGAGTSSEVVRVLRPRASMASSVASDVTSASRLVPSVMTGSGGGGGGGGGGSGGGGSGGGGLRLQSPAAARATAAATRALLVDGALFVKHGRRGSPHLRFVWVDGDLLAVHWRAVGKDRAHTGRGSMLVSSLLQVVDGRKTSVFGRSTGRDDACFSLIAADRTLDLEVRWPGAATDEAVIAAEERALRDKWAAAFRMLLAATKRAVRAQAARSGGGGAVGGGDSDDDDVVRAARMSEAGSRAGDSGDELSPAPPTAAVSTAAIMEAMEVVVERASARALPTSTSSALPSHTYWSSAASLDRPPSVAGTMMDASVLTGIDDVDATAARRR